MNDFDLDMFAVSALDDLDAGLRLLTTDEMREFSKRFHCQSKSNQSKKISIENLKNLTSQYKSMFGSSNTNRDHLLFKELRIHSIFTFIVLLFRTD